MYVKDKTCFITWIGYTDFDGRKKNVSKKC